MDVNADPGFRLFRSRYSQYATGPAQASSRLDPVLVWELTPPEAKLLWQSEAGGIVPFPTYDLGATPRDFITPFKLWFDHYVLVLESLRILQPDFAYASQHIWQSRDAEVVRYWTLKALDLQRQIDERQRRLPQTANGQSYYRDPPEHTGSTATLTSGLQTYYRKATNSQDASSSTSESADQSAEGDHGRSSTLSAPATPGRLVLSDVERKYYLRSGRPYVCSTCQRSYRGRRGLQSHLFSSSTCNRKDEALKLQLWVCPGVKTGVCDWKTCTAKDMVVHLESMHGVRKDD